MKKLWSLRKKDDAVSPVIATILMVAITVVLAAVLYVMVLGFSGGGGENLIIGLNYETTGDGLSWKISVANVDGTATESELYVSIAYANGTQASNALLSTYTPGTAASGVTYYEIATGATLIAGDYFLLLKSTYPTGTTFQLVSGDQVAGGISV